jgi:hypothetical protein
VGAGNFVFFLFGGAGFGGLVVLRQIVVLQFGQSEMGFLTGKLVVWNMFFSPIQLGIIIPTDELIFIRGVQTTNQFCLGLIETSSARSLHWLGQGAATNSFGSAMHLAWEAPADLRFFLINSRSTVHG